MLQSQAELSITASSSSRDQTFLYLQKENSSTPLCSPLRKGSKQTMLPVPSYSLLASLPTVLHLAAPVHIDSIKGKRAILPPY